MQTKLNLKNDHFVGRFSNAIRLDLRFDLDRFLPFPQFSSSSLPVLFQFSAYFPPFEVVSLQTFESKVFCELASSFTHSNKGEFPWEIMAMIRVLPDHRFQIYASTESTDAFDSKVLGISKFIFNKLHSKKTKLLFRHCLPNKVLMIVISQLAFFSLSCCAQTNSSH